MSILLKSTAIAAIVLGASYGLGLLIGPSISTQIEIAAPASQVWDELVDGDAYPEWNPFVKHCAAKSVNP